MASAPAYSPKRPVADDRRGEPRFGAEGNVTLVVVDGPNEYELPAKLLDFSLHGLRLQLPRELNKGQQVRVLFSWGEASTQVMWTAPLGKGFETGLQLF